MTTIDRFDPFERRITEAIQAIANERRPDYLDEVFEATARSRQRRRWTFPERWIPVNRLVIAAAAAMLIVATGAVLLISFRGPSVGPPRPSPTPTTATPVATPIVDAETLARSGLGRGMGFPSEVPDFLKTATWVADSELIPALGQTSPRLRLAINASGRLAVFVNDTQVAALVSAPVTGGAEELTLVSVDGDIGCQAGDLGRYQILTSAEARGAKRDWAADDSVEMQLTAVRDDCSARAEALGRTWTRSLDRESTGGRGVIAEFMPALLITLPDASFTTNNGNESANISSEALVRNLVAVKDPTGWTDPCSDAGGSKIQLAHTIDAFINYIGTLPGFTIGQQDYFKLDGHDAVRFVVPTTKTPACQRGGPDNGRVIEWGTSNLDDPGFWMLAQGDTDVIYLVQVGGDLYLLQWLGDGVTSDEEQGVLTTAHFIEELPTTLP